MNSKAPGLMVATIVIFAATILICLLAFVPNRHGVTNDLNAPQSDIQLDKHVEDGPGSGSTTTPWSSPAPSPASPMLPPSGSNP